MATKTAAAQRKVAAKPAFKGKYPGPDKYKGKPPPKAAPKAKAAPKPAATRVTVPNAPVSNSTGNLVDPNQWQQDQARLVAAREDQEELLNLKQEEDEANIGFMTDKNEADRLYNQRKLEVEKQQKDYAQQKEIERADLGSNLAYRGVGSRGSAASRKWGQLSTQQAMTEQGLRDQATANLTDYGSTVGNLEGARNTRLGRITGARHGLAGRASAAGSYTTGAGSVSDTGVSAPKPVSKKPPASPYNKTLAPKKKAPAKKKVTKAAQRRVATKAKKK